jgi:hypothetical protein
LEKPEHAGTSSGVENNQGADIGDLESIDGNVGYL